MKIRDQLKKLFQNNQGTTMTEVLVGFAMLVLLLEGIVQLMNLSSNWFFEAADVLRAQEAFVEEFYQKNHGDMNVSVVKSGLEMTETDADGVVLSTGGKMSLSHAKVFSIEQKPTVRRRLDIVVHFVDYE